LIISITFPVSNAEAAAVITAPPSGGLAALAGPPARPSPFTGPGVTPPAMLWIMDLGYLEARSRGGLVLTHLRQNAADMTTLEGWPADERA